ncbi:MAG: efflux RND transporter permease subunit [Desulfobacterales bacterium]|nr:efflux RND transporter permease subunit [Desulfobacterales bacterium]
MADKSAATQPAGGPIRWMAGHSVAANLLMLLLLLGGLFLGTRIKQEVFPDFELDMVSITVPYPGASPQEVEQGILLAVEEAVEGLEGIEKITSTAREGAGTVTVEMIEGEDIQRLSQEIQAEVDRIVSFPEEAEDPQVSIVSRKRYVVSLALHGDQSELVLRELAERLRDRLLEDPEITQVELAAVRDFEISVEVPQQQLRTYGLTLEEVADRIRRASVELPGGAIKTPGGDVLIRMKERRDFGQEFGRIPIITAKDGTRVLLEDIATVKDGFEETDYESTYNGQPAVLVEVYRVGEQTPVQVSDAVKKAVAAFEPSLPPGIGIDLQNDRSDIYRQRLGLLLNNGYLGLCLVFLLLALFLEPRLAFWVSLGIPISFLGSLLILPAAGVSINMVSMFAFIVTLGIVVDDAIVVGENVYHHRQQGKPWFFAAVTGAREIAMPVTFGVLTNMVAFVPMFFVPGIMGKVFRQIPVVVIFVFAVSLVESLFILPAHLGHQKDRRSYGVFARVEQLQARFSRAFVRAVHRFYRPALGLVLRWRYVSVGVAVAVLILTVGYVRSGRLGFELFPKVESDYAMATATLPFGSAFERTQRVQRRLVDEAKAVAAAGNGERLVEGIFATIEGNVATVRVYLPPPDVRPVSTSAFTDRWRQRVGLIPGLESLRFESDAGGPGRGAAISLELSHHDLNVLEKASADLADTMSFYPTVVDVDDGFSLGKQQIDFQVLPEARSLGLRAREIARQVRSAYYGAEAIRQQRGRNEVKVMVRLPKRERISEYNLEELMLRTPAGGELPLQQAVTVQRGRSYTSIDRRGGRRVVTVSADVRPRSKADEVLRDVIGEVLPSLQGKYSGLGYSLEGSQADRRESMQALFQGLAAVLVVIYAMLAVPLNSYVQPAIIMVSIPFGIVGAVIGHLIMGYSLSVMSMFGVLALTGVVVNDSLVLIDRANIERRDGASAYAAILAAGQLRFRPILLTTLTTFGGLTPMIFETSRQARFLIPMAVSLGFGVLFATVITLALVPSIYMIVEDFKRIAKKAEGGRALGESADASARKGLMSQVKKG